MAYNHYSDKDMFVSSRNPIIIILIRDKHINAIINSTNMMLMERMEMLSLWNVMQNKKFQYDVKYEMFSGYVLWWSELFQYRLIIGFPWKMLSDWPLLVGLALLYPPFVGYGQLVGEANLPPWLEDMYYDDVSPGIPGIVGNARCLAPWC